MSNCTVCDPERNGNTGFICASCMSDGGRAAKARRDTALRLDRIEARLDALTAPTSDDNQQ